MKVIQDKVIEFKTQFSGKDMQDYVAMVLVWFATEKTDTSSAPSIPPGFLSKLDSIESALDSALTE